MENFELKTAVAFIIFNRPETTKLVFERIRSAKPKKLLVIADGPRADRSGEKERCQICRDIIKAVDWDCEVLTNYSEKNLGCKKRVSSGLDWVFSTVEEAIILEDDCLPDETFFCFCQELLERYRNDRRIMIISGDNFQDGIKRNNDSYYFSKLLHIWGWASWRRAWENYDVDMSMWPKVKSERWMEGIFCNKKEVTYWEDVFQKTYDGKINTWDYQWFFASLINNGLNIMPNINMISNIGFGADATHTMDMNSKQAKMHIESIEFPLNHPSLIVWNKEADEKTMREQFSSSNLIIRGLRKIKSFLGVTGS